MDQIKTGRFIAAIRKEHGLTQKQLADKLAISDKTVSKWETGNGLPEISLMLPLCEILGISVNELLCGERLTLEEYKQKAEENMVKLMNEKQENRKKLILAFTVAIITLVSALTILLLADLTDLKDWQRIVLFAISAFVLIGGLSVACVLEKDAGVYECRKCGARFIPGMKAYLIGPHFGTTRKFKCPECGKKSYCKKRLTKEKE